MHDSAEGGSPATRRTATARARGFASSNVCRVVADVPNLPAQSVLEIQNQVLELIATNAPLDETLGAIARFSEDCIPGMMASILYYEPTLGCLKRGGYGKLPASFADMVDGLVPGPNMGSCGTCAHTHERIISVDVRTDPLWANFLPVCETYGIRSAWSSPLHSGRDGRLLGVFGMYHAQPRAPSDAELAIVDHFAHLAAIAAERYREDTEQRHRASHDALTEIGNRHLLDLEGPDYLGRLEQSRAPLCVVFLDLDRFKTFNDVFGHVAGDGLLREIGTLLRTRFTAGELLIRFGGDEFLILVPASLAETQYRLALLREAVAASPILTSFGIRVTFSIGIVDYNHVKCSLDTLIFAADEASRRAKALGGDTEVIGNPVESAHTQHGKLLGVTLTEALDAGHLNAHLQPIVRLSDGTPTGFELLLRISDPRFAHVPVPQIIAIAEDNGLIHRIGLDMLRTACRLLTEEAAVLAGLTLNVNVSVKQLVQRDFLEHCRRLLLDLPVDPERICLELTESHWLDTEGPARAALVELRKIGFTLAIDDFGTGYASLTYLQSLPVSTIKVDKRFVQQAPTSRRDRSLCAGLLSMGEACDLKVVAEGIETREQARLLSDLGYAHGQGYLWSRPMPVSAALRWLSHRTREAPDPVADDETGHGAALRA